MLTQEGASVVACLLLSVMSPAVPAGGEGTASTRSPVPAACERAGFQAVPAADPARRGVEAERRAFDVRSADAWTVVQRRLKELGLGVDQLDRENQALRTKWLLLRPGNTKWLPAPELPSPYVAERIRFVVFVSPFVEPARVSVGSFLVGLFEVASPSEAVANSVTVREALRYLADCRCRSGKALEAERDARAALRVFTARRGGDSPRSRESEGALGCALLKQRRYADAEPVLLNYATALAHNTAVEGDLVEAIERLVGLYDAWGKPEKAAEWRRKLAATPK